MPDGPDNPPIWHRGAGASRLLGVEFVEGLAPGEGRPERLRAQTRARRCPVMGCPSGCVLGPEGARTRRFAAILRSTAPALASRLERDDSEKREGGALCPPTSRTRPTSRPARCCCLRSPTP